MFSYTCRYGMAIDVDRALQMGFLEVTEVTEVTARRNGSRRTGQRRKDRRRGERTEEGEEKEASGHASKPHRQQPEFIRVVDSETTHASCRQPTTTHEMSRPGR